MAILKQMSDWFRSNLPGFEALVQKGSPIKRSNGLEKVKTVARKVNTPSELVKSRPVTLQERYRIVEDSRQIEAVFKHIASPLLDYCDRYSAASRNSSNGKVVLRELGSTDDKRSYLYMKPLSADGLLMERSGAGWRISKAEKIIGRNMFMRSHQDPWDLVTVWNDPKGEGLTRLRSQRFSQDLLSVSEYERRLCESLNHLFETGVEQ